jgi:hypothetical protein
MPLSLTVARVEMPASDSVSPLDRGRSPVRAETYGSNLSRLSGEVRGALRPADELGVSEATISRDLAVSNESNLPTNETVTHTAAEPGTNRGTTRSDNPTASKTLNDLGISKQDRDRSSMANGDFFG